MTPGLVWFLAADDSEGTGVGGKGTPPPTEPVEMYGAWWDMWKDFSNNVWLVCIALFFVSGGMLTTFIVLDHNRGEAGIASTDQARVTKWTLGIVIASSAAPLATYFML